MSDVLLKRNTKMHSSDIGRDFVLVSSEGTEHPVHKVVLSAASPVFCRMFSSNLEECKTGRCEIPDIDDATLTGLVRYMYLGCLECVKEDAKKLLAAADKYQVLDLKNHCQNVLIDNLNMDNVVDLLFFAQQMVTAELKQAALRYMAADPGKTMASAGMDSLLGSGKTELITEVFTAMLKLPKN
ncbi:hypothetical protein RvY_17837 [Ramazzottius varieornatus]|uniref:BTB domain-containing protein n=1 Tax=Ramazzottius varieornatus TaxID=947166 RepID=A0A1D1W3K5_RAMVA|nr:hypothetical protein RvY_17837 [Ramazzottius varieornatus]